MKKLLLVMLVPLLVLGILGCEGVTDTEVDAFMQGSWVGAVKIGTLPFEESNGQILIVAANQMSVQDANKTSSIPYRVDFAYDKLIGKSTNVIKGPTTAFTGAGAATTSAGQALISYLDSNLGIDVLDAASASLYIPGNDIAEKFGTLLGLTPAEAITFAGYTAATASAAANSLAGDFLTNLDALFPTNGKTIIGDLTLKNWENGTELGTYKTFYAAGAATKVHFTSFKQSLSEILCK